jgi:diguanylate cyclase (GGDEF)-like protein
VTLRARLTTVFVAVVVIPLLVGAVLLASSLPSAFGEQQGRAATAAARFGSSLVADACTRARTAAEVAGRSVLALPPGSTDRQVEALQELVQRDLADGLQVSGDDGLVAGAGRVPPDPVDCRTAEATSGAVTAVVALQQPGGDGAAMTTGTAVAAVLLDDAFARQLQENSGGDVALIAQGEVVASTAQPPAGLLRTALTSEDAPVHEGRWVAVYEPPGPGAPLGVLVVQQAPRGIAVVRTTGAVVLGAVLLAAGLALLLARATVRPLEELGEAAERVAGGDLSTTIDVRSRDEVGQLASAFNVMTDRLRDYVGALETSRDELRVALARLGQTLTSTHDLDRILAVVLETALASTTARSGAVLLRQDSQELVLAAASGLPETVAGAPLRVPAGTGVVGQVVLDGKQRRGAVADLDDAPLDEAAQWVLAVPLRSSDEVLGVLVLYDPRPDSGGGDDDLTTLRTLADQAAVAVENVLRHRDVALMAVTDGLTGLANYRSFTETIGREIERATRFGRPVGLVLLDIDHFKRVNDTFGHQRGDAVLVELAARVRGQVRDVDTVARYGGEELVVVLPETDVDGAELAAERIRTAVGRRPFAEPGEEAVSVTVSLGVAVHGVHATTASALLRRADQALYAAKRAGRDTWRTASLPDSPPATHHDAPGAQH